MGKTWDDLCDWVWHYHNKCDNAVQGYNMTFGFFLACLLSPLVIALFIPALLGLTLHRLIRGSNANHQ